MIYQPQSKLKIILLYPPTGGMAEYNTPTGLLYIATVLKKNGYNVVLVDCSVEPNYRQILENEIKNTDLLGVYAMSIHIKYLLPELARLKKINPGVKIIWGGPHASLFPEQTVLSDLADIVVPGEGEEVMLEISRGLESGRLNLHEIKGVTFKENGSIISTPDRDFIDMNELPFIDWSFLKKEVFEVVKRTIIRIQASRGCPYKCTFCINVVSKNKKMRYRTANSVLDEIEYLYKEFEIKRVGFRDEVFMSNRRQVEDIAKGLLERNIRITWLANPRAEYLRESYVDDNYIKLLADSGCNKLQTGGESGSQRVLDFLKKGCKVEDILTFVKRAKKFNITTVVSFITGLPTETKEEQAQTLRLIRDILRIQPKAFINGPQFFRPYPGGELYDLCVKKYNIKMPNSLEEWARADILGGAHPPWVDKSYFNQYLWISTKAASKYSNAFIWEKMLRNPLKGIGVFLLAKISKFRLNHVFYKFPFEFRLLDWYHRLILKKIPELS